MRTFGFTMSLALLSEEENNCKYQKNKIHIVQKHYILLKSSINFFLLFLSVNDIMMTKKTCAEKCKECVTIRSKMRELGFDTLEESKSIYQSMNEFIKGDSSIEGKVFVSVLQKYITYNFTVRAQKDSTVTLTR